MKAYRKMKLSGKISIVFIVMFAIGLLTVGVISYISASSALTSTIKTNFQNSAQSSAMLMSTKLDGLKTEAEMIAARYDIRTMNWDAQVAALQNLAKQLGYSQIGVSELKGQTKLASGKNIEQGDKDYFLAALEGKTAVSDPFVSELDGKSVFVVATPIKDSYDKIIGILLITHDSARITEMSNVITVGKSGYAFIVNSTGTIIAHPKAELVTNGFNAIKDAENDPSLRGLADVKQKMIAGETGFDTYSFEGVAKVAAYAPVPETTWSICLTAPKGEYFSQMTSLALISIGVTLLFVLLSALLVVVIVKKLVVRPIKQLVDVSDQLALGDTTVDIQISSADEIGALAQSFRTMIDTIRTQVSTIEQIAAGDLTVDVDVRSAQDILDIKLGELLDKNNEALNNISTITQQVALGAQQVSDFSVTLSQGATEQASSIQQLAASITEIAEKTKRNAEDASEASGLSERTRSNAVEGNRKMSDMLGAMEVINTSSGSISKIIKVIDDIAFQTNILALNAAVEAARAGQHGKGFAVVAEEVRSLAARSASAARDTTALIEDSVRNVENGAKIANETARSLQRIVDDVTKAAALVAGIAEASGEQSDSIRQINEALNQVNSVVQSNSATSEESAAASEELSAQAEFLKTQVSRFRLRSSGTVHTNALPETASYADIDIDLGPAKY